METWLRETRDDWPFWVLGGLIVLIGLLLWVPGGLLTLLLLTIGAAVGSLPFLREHLDGCERVSAVARSASGQTERAERRRPRRQRS